MKRIRISLPLVISVFILSLVAGFAGIHFTREAMTASQAASAEGQAILSLNNEVAAALLALAVGLLTLYIMQVGEERKSKDRVERELDRIAIEIGELLDTAAKLAEDTDIPHRYIWKRAAWHDAVTNRLSDNLEIVGLFYLLDNFYMAADALRDADHDRALHIWAERDLDKTPYIVGTHINNLERAAKPVIAKLKEIDVHVPTKNVK